jgi:hypothetical protein
VKRQRCLDTQVAAITARDFLARHGGRGAKDPREGQAKGGCRGWCEVSAADGYKLRCEWVLRGTEEQFTFSEIAPGS